MAKRIGIIGFGALGQYISQKIVSDNLGIVVFICNRSIPENCDSLPCAVTLLSSFSAEDMAKLLEEKRPDLVIEVAHPVITEKYGHTILQCCDYVVGSPTVFANEELLLKLMAFAKSHERRLFVPVGAFWGAEDVLRMADRGTLKALCISMTKHPSCFRLEDDELMRLNSVALERHEPVVLFEGPVGQLCKMAPNNVNTMAVGAIAAHNIGFQKTIGRLVSDSQLKDFHKIEIDIIGPTNVESGGVFTVKTVRMNPAPFGGVTGLQTYVSFLSSLKTALSFPGPFGLRIC